MQVKNLNKTECNQIYNNMYQRCYNEKVHQIKPWYTNCIMCDEWLEDKYSFYDWINDGNFYEIDGEPTVELDKDILVKGNNIYSPETCIFAPKSINSLFGGTMKKNDNGLPIGVLQTKNGKYKPQIRNYPDVFNTPEEAWEVWKEHKQATVIHKADEYLGKIPMKLYYAMLSYEFEITD